MTLLATIAPMLAHGGQFNFSVAIVNGALRVVTNPTIANFQPDTTDAELAAIQAALVMPIVLTIPNQGDLDAELAALLRQAQTLRQPSIDRLAAYNDAQREASNAAQIARDKKTESAKTPAKPAKASKGGTASPAAQTGVSVATLAGASATDAEQDEGADEGEDAQDTAGDAAQADSPAAAPPVPAASINLFD